MGAIAGQLPIALSRLDINVADIDDLLLTHMHPDHMGGAFADGIATFPNAVLHVSETDAAYWSDQSNAESVPDIPVFSGSEYYIELVTKLLRINCNFPVSVESIPSSPLTGNKAFNNWTPYA